MGATKPGDAAGVIGKAKTFDGKATRFAMTGTASSKMNFPDNGIWTLSAWANLAAAPKGGTYYNVINKSDVQYNLVCNDVGKWEVTQFSPTKRYDMVGLGVANKAAASTWVHVVGIRNGSKQHLYLDGVAADTTIKSKTESFPYSNTYDVGIGGQTNGGTDIFNGMIDEVRIENVARSKDWIKLLHETQKANANYLTFTGTSSIGSQFALQPRARALRVERTARGLRVFAPFEGQVVMHNLQGRQTGAFAIQSGWNLVPGNGLAENVSIFSVTPAP
jgi:hypothetical protein